MPANSSVEDVKASVVTPAENFFVLVSNDDVKMNISAKAIRHSVTLSDLINAMNTNNGDANEVNKMSPIPVPNVNAMTLKLVIEWCEHHKDEEPAVDSLEDDSIQLNLPAWDEEWFKTEHIDNEMLFELICAANYLNIVMLLHFGCKTVANMSRGKSPEEIRLIYGIPSDEELAKQRATAEATENTLLP